MAKRVRGTLSAPSRAPIDWARLKAEICDRLDIGAEYEALGVVFTEPGPGPSGFRPCHAFGRADGSKDNRPSAAVKIQPGDKNHGIYTDQGGRTETVGFFDFALKHGKFDSFLDCVKHYADKAGVQLGIVETSGKNVVDRIYEYRDADGNLSYGVFRLIPKDFRQYPWKDGKWVKERGCMRGIKPLPYHLPELLAAPIDAVIYAVEGEKDVERLESLGFHATTNHQGAKSTDKTWPHFLPYFEGRDIVSIPDNDPAGRAHSRGVCGITSAVARRVRMLALPGINGQPPPRDVSEWFDQGGTAEALTALTRACPDWDGSDALPETADSATGRTGPLPLDSGLEPSDVRLLKMSDVVRKDVQWFIHNKIPLGKITLIAGPPDLGKSWLTMDLAARLSVGGEIPGGSGEMFVPASSLILFAEDDAEDTVAPRLHAAGADLTKIQTIQMIRVGNTETFFTLEHIEYLDYILCLHPEIRLVIIDPIVSYLGRGKDTNRDTDIRALMEPLAAVARRHGIAVIAICHLNKSDSPNAMNRINGTGAFPQLARSTWMVFPDREKKGNRLLLSVKNNLTPDKSGFAYRMGDNRVIWEDEAVPMTAQEYIDEYEVKEKKRGGGRPQKSREEAVEWIKEYLRTHGAARSESIFLAAKDSGFGRSLIWEAKELANVKAKKEWSETEGTQWLWKLGDFVASTNGHPPTGDAF